MAEERKKLTVPDLALKKQAGEKVVMASIPDYPSAVWAERAGLDIAAVGDSLGMVSYGFPNTLPVTIDMMIAHAQAVRRGAPNCMIMVSMPYGSYATPDVGVINALRLMKEGGADVVKMQVGREKAPIIRAIADAGVPVMSHVGMCPHFVHQYGGFKLQGRTADEALRIVEDGFEIEAVPAPVAKAVDDAVKIFTFGIGAGGASCGQLLLAFDLLGVFDQFKPKFTKRYANVSGIAVAALAEFAAEVRAGKFPDAEHSYGMKPRRSRSSSRRSRTGRRSDAAAGAPRETGRQRRCRHFNGRTEHAAAPAVPSPRRAHEQFEADGNSSPPARPPQPRGGDRRTAIVRAQEVALAVPVDVARPSSPTRRSGFLRGASR
jgi:3-methyl-2-oxobutanoate hydroxymethyltransferase